MLIEEFISGNLIKHYSDVGMLILQKETGILYPDAVDVIPCQFTYEETNQPINIDEDGEVTAEDILNILLGGDDE